MRRARQRLKALLDDLRGILRPTGEVRPPRVLDRSGSGDYTLIGRQFRGYFFEVGGLEPSDAVLDVGCGFGRMATALTEVLRPPASYHGFDVSRRGIRWCQRHIAAHHPAFHFLHVDLYNREYNPRGRFRAAELVFPYPDESFGFVIATSVFTHLLPTDAAHYLDEIARVLRPGGTLFATFFLLNDASRTLLDSGAGDFPFVPTDDVHWTTDPATPERAVAYPEPLVLERLDGCGLVLARPVLYGAWCGRRPFFDYQDIVVAQREPSGGR